MKLASCPRVPLLLVLALVAAVVSVTPAAATRYVCPPCGVPCDTLTFDAPGTCPQCGMKLVEAGSVEATPAPDKKRVAILIFDAVEIVDSAGPYEMFGAANCDVYTVARTKDAVTTAMGMTVVPKYSFADAPLPDVLVVPGGGIAAARRDEALLRWVADVSAKATVTMSVCNGAFILAHAGLLDGLTATTTAGNIDRLAKEFPKVKVVRDRRVVDNGKIVTTGGLSAGMDGALHVIERLFGTGTAQFVALQEEYDWHAASKFARAALADQEIPDVDLSEVGRWDVDRTEGTTTHWEIAVRLESSLSQAEIMEHISKALETGGWKRTAARPAATSGKATRSWTFTGRDREPWNGTLALQGVPGEPHHYTGKLTVGRAGTAHTER